MRIFRTALILSSLAAATLAQNAALTPTPRQQFFDANGKPAAGGCLYSYAAGTSTPQATYTDSSGGTPNTNPVSLDSAGRANVWLGAQTYKLILTAKPLSGACAASPTGTQFWSQDSVSDLGLMLVKADMTLNGKKTFTDDATFQGSVSVVGAVSADTATANTVTGKTVNAVRKAEMFAGADAGAKITAAIADLPAGGGIVDARGIQGAQAITTDVFTGVTKPGVLLLDAATYTLSGNGCINVPSNWRVEGTWNTVFAGSGNCANMAGRIVMTTGSNVTFRGFKVQGSNTAPESCVAALNGANHIVFDGLWAANCGQYGIVVGDNLIGGVPAGGMTDFTAENNIVSDFGNASNDTAIGIEFFPRGGAGALFRHEVIRDNYVTGASGKRVGAGIKLNSALGGLITGNTVDLSASTVTGSAGAIALVSSQGARIANNPLIKGCKNGIAVSGVAGADNGLTNSDITIDGNQLTDQTQNAIYSSEGVPGLKIRGNTIRAGTTATLQNSVSLAVVSLAYTGLDISGNDVERIIQATADDATVTNNRISAATTYSVYITGNRPKVLGNVIVDGNTSNIAAVPGIYIAGGAGGIVSKNTVRNATGHIKYGLTLNAQNDVLYRDNSWSGLETGEVNELGSITSRKPPITETALGSSAAPWANVYAARLKITDGIVVAGPTGDVAPLACATNVVASYPGALTSSVIVATPVADVTAKYGKDASIHWWPQTDQVVMQVCNRSATDTATFQALNWNVRLIN